MILTKEKIKSISIDKEITDIIESGKLNTLLWIVPTNRKIRYLKKEIISRSPGRSASKINLETVGTFSTKLLLGDQSSKERLLNDAASSVLIKQSFQESGLKYFFHYKGDFPAGTLERVKNVISEYKKHGITPGILREQAAKLSGSEKIKAEDIAGIFEKYQNKCFSLNVLETGDIYNQLIELGQEEIQKRFKELFPFVNLIVVSGFDEFTTPEIEIINNGSEIEGCRLFLSFDYYEKNPLIFSHLDTCYSKLISKKFTPVVDLSADDQNKFHLTLRERLFKPNKEKISDYNKEITKLTAGSREDEISMIAKEIKDLITEKNVPPDRICVAFNLIGKYSPIVRDIFPVYGLPFNLTDRFSLSTSMPVLSVINFLEIIENDFYYKNIFRALSGGYLDLNININNLLKASKKLKIISGFSNWTETLKDAIKQIDEKDEEDGSYGVRYDKEIYQRALEDIKKLNSVLDNFNKPFTLKEFNKNFLEIIYTLKIPEKLLNTNDTGTEENIKSLTVFIDTVNELLQLFQLEYKKEKKFPLKFYLNSIRTAVSSTRFNIKEKPGYGIQVTTLNEIRGLEFDYLFIAGLSDGDFPTRYMPEIFYSDSYFRNELRHQTEERYNFYQTLCVWKKGLYLSHPLREERSELSESGFLKEFVNLFEVQDKSVTDYKNKIYSTEELLVLIGKENVKNNYENTGLDFQKIQDAINVDNIRFNDPFGESEFTGHILNNLTKDGKEKIDEFSSREFSISQLEKYAKCPFQYFAERVLRLKPIEEPSEEIEALEMGSLLHKILYEFYKELKHRDIIISQSSPEEFKEAEKLIFETAQKIIEENNFNSPLTFYEKEKILGINGNRKNSLLYQFLLKEKESAGGFIPEYFEKSFGETYSAGEFKAGNIKVRGKIDRIDIDEEGKRFKVIDYKLGGAKPSQADLERNISLQLPLYMYASKVLIKAELDKDYEPAGADIYSLRFNENEFGRKPVKTSRKDITEEEIKNLIEDSLKAIEKFASSIKKGKFHLSLLEDRESKICRFCNFKSVCRIQEAG